MGYISAIKGGSISLVIFLLLVFVLPTPSETPEGIEVILTISTFLFAILCGFFISRLNSRYNTIRDVTAAEDARWLSLYELSSFFGHEFFKRVTDLIDQYYIIIFDVYELGKHYNKSAFIVHDIYQLFEDVELKDTNKGQEIYDDVLKTLGEIEENRNKSSVLSSEGMTSGQWGMVVLLGGIIIFSMFFSECRLCISAYSQPFFHL